MRFCRCVAVALGLVLLASAPPTEAALKEGAVVVKSPPSVAPLKSGAVTTHVPYGTGECTLCHEKAKSGKGVGPAVKPVNKTCYFCHEDVQNIMTSAKFRHATAGESCTSCHNPHNSEYKSLLVAPMPGLCTKLALGYIDDPKYAPHKQDTSIAPYNLAAAQKGYKVDFVAADGFTVSLDSRDLDHNDQVILAMYKNGEVVPDGEFPLVLVWDRSAKKVPAGIKNVKMIAAIKASGF